MNTGVVSRRFAKALLAYAKGEGLEDKVYKEVKTLAAHFAEVPGLRRAACLMGSFSSAAACTMEAG